MANRLRFILPGRKRPRNGRSLLTSTRLLFKRFLKASRKLVVSARKSCSPRFTNDLLADMELPLAAKRVAVLVETEFIWAELDCYIKRFPELGASVDLLSYLWGARQRELVPDIDSP